MSWDKNTIRDTKIDNTIEVLKENNIPYTVEVLGTVEARGINDDYQGIKEHTIRKLTYQKFVILEQMVRSDDCDVNDIIETMKVNIEDTPKEWEIDVYLEVK